MKQTRTPLLCLLLVFALLTGCMTSPPAETIDLETLPDFSGEPYVVLNDNQPSFPEEDLTLTESFESYSELDDFGRCGAAYANVGRDTMPAPGEQRGSISSVKPTGWKNADYDWVECKHLYNRCHLIGYQLTAENANKENLITGTRYFNVDAMLPFENLVADYVKETGNHVLYRVTPDFREEELVARGAVMEGWSVEDQGEGVCFNVYAYNCQPGVTIDYATGENWASKDGGASGNSSSASSQETYILNTNSHKFHRPDCGGAGRIQAQHAKEYHGIREQLIADGYSPCGQCHP